MIYGEMSKGRNNIDRKKEGRKDMKLKLMSKIRNDIGSKYQKVEITFG